jgi:hypothetical protein
MFETLLNIKARGCGCGETGAPADGETRRDQALQRPTLSLLTYFKPLLDSLYRLPRLLGLSNSLGAASLRRAFGGGLSLLFECMVSSLTTVLLLFLFQRVFLSIPAP